MPEGQVGFGCETKAAERIRSPCNRFTGVYERLTFMYARRALLQRVWDYFIWSLSGYDALMPSKRTPSSPPSQAKPPTTCFDGWAHEWCQWR